MLVTFPVDLCSVQNEERFLPGFQGSVSYVRLLAELDLLKDPSSRSDEEDSQSLDEISLSDNVSLSSFDADFTPLEGAAGMNCHLVCLINVILFVFESTLTGIFYLCYRVCVCMCVHVCLC
jgi:hypothetical protein